MEEDFGKLDKRMKTMVRAAACEEDSHVLEAIHERIKTSLSDIMVLKEKIAQREKKKLYNRGKTIK